MSIARSSRKERERQQHRQEILSAALKLFAEKGFQSVSMQEIAAAAEFATGTLYNFFPSKEDLFFELLVVTAEESLGLLLSTLDGPGDERDRISRYIRCHEQVIHDQGPALRLYVLESSGRCLPGPRVEAKKKEIDDQINSRLAQTIADGITRGVLNNVDPVVAAKCLSSSLEAFILAAVGDPQPADVSGDLKKVETLFFGGLAKP